MKIALLGAARRTGGAGRARSRLDAWRERAEDRIEPLDDRGLSADHVAIASLQTPHAAADADIDVMQAFLPQRAGTAQIVMVVGVAAVDDGVPRLQQRRQLGEDRIDR